MSTVKEQEYVLNPHADYHGESIDQKWDDIQDIICRNDYESLRSVGCDQARDKGIVSSEMQLEFVFKVFSQWLPRAAMLRLNRRLSVRSCAPINMYRTVCAP